MEKVNRHLSERLRAKTTAKILGELALGTVLTAAISLLPILYLVTFGASWVRD